MDLGALPTGIMSPLIPVLLWALFALMTSIGVAGTVVTVRRGGWRRSTLMVGGALVVLGIGVGLALGFRTEIARAVDGQTCQPLPDGVYFVGTFESGGEVFPPDPVERCLALEYRLAAVALGGYAVASSAVLIRSAYAAISPSA